MPIITKVTPSDCFLVLIYDLFATGKFTFILDPEKFIEGDIPNVQNAIISGQFRLWSNGIVPYTISNVFSPIAKNQIRSALQIITTAAPCLRFQEYISNAPFSHISVVRRSG